jgi:hypothetical protein
MHLMTEKQVIRRMVTVHPDWKIGLPAVEIRGGWIHGYNRGRGIAAEQYKVD